MFRLAHCRTIGILCFTSVRRWPAQTSRHGPDPAVIPAPVIPLTRARNTRISRVFIPHRTLEPGQVNSPPQAAMAGALITGHRLSTQPLLRRAGLDECRTLVAGIEQHITRVTTV